ncbi:hypothetical protein tb265_10760 [Gemmatimonadetes bacterium T265]|nr:hypothetical protein tb265_10760 [Gemmatimonadetes bacterium T265]
MCRPVRTGVWTARCARSAWPASCLHLAVFRGEYRWHHPPMSDELFLVVESRLELDVAGGPFAD